MIRASITITRHFGYRESELVLLPTRKYKQILQAIRIEVEKNPVGGGRCPFMT